MVATTLSLKALLLSAPSASLAWTHLGHDHPAGCTDITRSQLLLKKDAGPDVLQLQQPQPHRQTGQQQERHSPDAGSCKTLALWLHTLP